MHSPQRISSVINRFMVVFVCFASCVLLIQADAHAAISSQERNALIDLYNSSNGANWTNKTGWLGAAGTECGWYGVNCDATQTSVTVLSLDTNRLSGSIPSSLGSLGNLQYLYLGFNQLSGSIPSSLGSLSNLQRLYLFDNQLSGSIPSSLGSLSNLQYLQLYSNQLDGSIPSSLGDLVNLRGLDLHSNQLSGRIPSSLSNLSRLQYLYLWYNQLSGSIPPELGNLGSLQELDLTGNQLSGSIPSSLGNLSNLQFLNLGHNQLSGSIPPSLSNLSNLKSLFLEYNALYASDPALLSFLNSKEPNWKNSQTVPPTNLYAIPQSNFSILVSWSMIAYNGNGRYEAYQSTTSGGPYTRSGSTLSKATSVLVVTALAASTTYYFVVRAVSDPYAGSQNTLYSEFSSEVSATTPAPNPVPLMTRMSPTGVLAGGTGFDLEVYGEDFVRLSNVLWNGVELDGVIFMSSRQLRAPVPASLIESAREVEIKVSTPPNGGGETKPLVLTIGNSAPVTMGLNLQSVIAGRSGYEVGIYGANFLPESVAEWNGSGRATRFVDSRHLTVTLQAGDITAAGTVSLTVQNPDGRRSNGQSLEVVALPAGSPEIQRLVPDTVDAGGAGFTLVVDGSGYVPGSTVEWNGQGKVTKYGSGGQLSAEIPASDIARAAESYSVVVRNPVSGASAQSLWPKDTGSGGSNAGVVSKRNPGPEVTGLSPAAVVAGSGGLQLRIIGGGYVEGKSVVGWNDVGLASSYVSSTELSVNIPAGYVATEGTATIEVRNPSPGGGAMAKTLTILPSAEAKAVLMYPRLMSVGGEADATESTGIAVANLSARAVKLTAWAYGKGGEEIRGEQITNPVSVTMSGEEQQAIIDWQVFGEKLREAGRGEGWLKLESTEKQVAGFFMMFNDSLTFLDGANASATGMQEFVLPEVADRGETEVYVANPNGESANVTFELRKEDGQQRGGAVQRQASGRGTLAVLLKDLFSGVAAEGGDYVRAVSDRKVVTLEYMGEKPKYVYALSGQEVVGGSRVLYGPQYVVGEQWRTTISVVNVDGASGTVTFRLINDEGMQIGEAKAVAIRGYGKVQVTDQDFFIGGDKSGYVEVRSDGPRLTGAIVFGDPERETMATSLPLTTELMTTMVFGHVVSNETWWTGITLINPGVADAFVTVELYDRMGTLVRSKQERIAAGCRRIGLLSQYFEGLGDQQGYMKVTSDQGLAGFAIFGTNELSVISAIPPQVVPAE
jgi:Leucine-rich repeat (LRR) protein